MAIIDPRVVKRESEAIIVKAGGQICDWLPTLDPDVLPRTLDAVVRRALILNAMIQIAFKAPVRVIKGWILRHGLGDALSEHERGVLERDNESLSEQEVTDIHWWIEALWALVWAGSLIDEMPFDEHAGNSLASLCPDLQRDEDGSKLTQRMRLRPHSDLFRMLDLYFRLHWWTRSAQLQEERTGNISIDVIMERRKALEWVMDAACEWDSVDLST